MLIPNYYILLVAYRSIVPLLAFVPLLSTALYYGITNQDATSIQTAITETGGQSRSTATQNGDADDKVDYFLSLTSAYRPVPIYERKGTFAPLNWGWGHDGIPINGSITNFPLNHSDLYKKIILIEAEGDEDIIFKKYVTTDANGTFNTSFFPPTSGSIKVSAMMLEQNTTDSVITVIVTESALPIMVIALLLIIALILITISESKWKTPKVQVVQSKKWKWIILIFVAIFTIIAYVILFKFPPFDEAGNTAFAAALLAPLAAYFYKVITYEETPKEEKK